MQIYVQLIQETINEKDGLQVQCSGAQLTNLEYDCSTRGRKNYNAKVTRHKIPLTTECNLLITQCNDQKVK
jgi:hypothetical protein